MKPILFLSIIAGMAVISAIRGGVYMHIFVATALMCFSFLAVETKIESIKRKLDEINEKLK